MRIQLVVLIFFILGNIQAQVQTNVLEGDRECGCEVLLYTIETPSDDDPGPTNDDPPYYVRGDLNEFVQVLNGQCKRKVHVLYRYLSNGVFAFQEDFMVNDVNTLLDVYKDRTSFCFRGNFDVREPIVLKEGKILKLLDRSTFTYLGTEGPVIDFKGNNSGIDGSGDGKIRTSTLMAEGVIRIESEGTSFDGNNANYNHVKNISLVNTDSSINPSGDPSASNGSANLGLYLSNTPESIYEHSDNGTNFYTNISNVEISGFSTGLHARGWSNAVLVRDITMKDITSYGIWVSGCIDNSFANIQFDNCRNASAIRLDNYVDYRYEDFTVAGTSYALTDPNQRAAIKLLGTVGSPGPLNEIFSTVADEDELKNELGLNNANGYIGTDLFGYNMIKEACGAGGKANYENELSKNDLGVLNLARFGFLGYSDDEPNYPNYPNDQLDVFQVYGLTETPQTNKINFFRKSFNHNVPPNPMIQLAKATCKESELLTNFYRPALFNSFSQVKILDDAGLLQVDHLLEISGREDDEALCLEFSDTNALCDPCSHEFRGRVINSVGSRNKIHFCGLPSSKSLVQLINNKTSCDYNSGINGVPIVTIINQ